MSDDGNVVDAEEFNQINEVFASIGDPQLKYNFKNKKGNGPDFDEFMKNIYNSPDAVDDCKIMSLSHKTQQAINDIIWNQHLARARSENRLALAKVQNNVNSIERQISRFY